MPVYNNAATLPELCRRLKVAIADRPLEIVLVDDGSSDDSRRVINALDVRALVHDRNRGQNAAILAGLRHASGAICCALDADLEDTPEGLARLVARLEEGDVHVVFSSREKRRRLSSRLFRVWLRWLFPSLPPQACLCFALDEHARAALLASASEDDYLVAVIGALRLPCAQVTIQRGTRGSTGPGLGGLRRIRYAMRVSRAAVRVWWTPPAARPTTADGH